MLFIVSHHHFCSRIHFAEQNVHYLHYSELSLNCINDIKFSVIRTWTSFARKINLATGGVPASELCKIAYKKYNL